MRIKINDKEYELEGFLSKIRQHVTVGRKSGEAHNCITIEDESVALFQCQLAKEGGEWVIENGQWRTECPKGIRHHKEVVCNACMGCCVNGTPGRPKYSWRYPDVPTMINGAPLPEGTTVLHAGDVITMGNVSATVY